MKESMEMIQIHQIELVMIEIIRYRYIGLAQWHQTMIHETSAIDLRTIVECKRLTTPTPEGTPLISQST